MSSEAHPTFFDLDLCALGVRPPEVSAHVESCPACKSYVERVATKLPLPDSLRERALHAPSGIFRRFRTLWISGGLGLGLAAAAALLIAGLPSREQLEIDGAKGNPSIALYVKRDAAVSLWDAQSPLRPGDRIQLKVSAEGYRFIAVGSSAGAGEPDWIYAGEADPRTPFLLPNSWRIDDAGGEERLFIVLSRERLAAAELNADASAQLRNGAVWTTRITLPKQPLEKQ